jgi:hypothetical protein
MSVAALRYRRRQQAPHRAQSRERLGQTAAARRQILGSPGQLLVGVVHFRHEAGQPPSIVGQTRVPRRHFHDGIGHLRETRGRTPAPRRRTALLKRLVLATVGETRRRGVLTTLTRVRMVSKRVQPAEGRRKSRSRRGLVHDVTVETRRAGRRTHRSRGETPRGRGEMHKTMELCMKLVVRRLDDDVGCVEGDVGCAGGKCRRRDHDVTRVIRDVGCAGGK